MLFLSLTVLIVVNILLLLLRRWLISQIMGKTRHWWTILLVSFLTSGLLALLPRLGTLLHLPQLTYTQITNYADTSFIRIVGALVLGICTVLYLGYRKLPSKLSLALHILFVFLRVGTLLFLQPLIPSVTLLRIVVALLEEWLKSGTSSSLWDRYHLVSSDILLFAILTSLGFAFVENMTYLLHYFQPAETSVRTSLVSTGGLLIKRSISSRIMHLCYTGLIARGIYQVRISKKRRYRLPLGILLGVGLHFLYNFFLGETNILAILVLLLGSYFFLTWLLYKSDRLYVQANS